MDFASQRASHARYTLVLSLLSGLSFLQYAPFAAAEEARSRPQDILSLLNEEIRHPGSRIYVRSQLRARPRAAASR